MKSLKGTTGKYHKINELEALRRKYPDFPPLVLLKLSMVWHGAALSRDALLKVQEPYYCFGESSPFGIDFQGRDGFLSMPGAVLLRDASFVYINYGEAYEDPYVIDWDSEREVFLLREGDREVDEVDFVPRPDFFGKTTSKGTPMEAVAEVRAQKIIFTSYQICRLWEKGEQCGFCALFTGKGLKRRVAPEDVRETLQEAVREPGRYSEVYLSGGMDFGGTPPFSREIERYINALQALGGCFEGRFPSQLMAPAYPKADLKRIYDGTGVTGYCPSIEILDKELFGKLCPGKEARIGYDSWVERTVEAVEVFGRGKVCTQIVAGAELAKPYGFEDEETALKSNLAGCEFFAKHDVLCMSTVWRPHKAARLGWQPMPSLEYYVRLAKGFHDIHRAYGLYSTNDDYKHCGNHVDADLERTDFADRSFAAVSRKLSGYKTGGLADEGAESGRNRGGAGDAACHIRFPDGDVYACDFALFEKECGFFLPVREERTRFGSLLTDALWYGRHIAIQVSNGESLAAFEAAVRRCHIVGRDFSECLESVRRKDPGADFTSVWEFKVLKPCGTFKTGTAVWPEEAPESERHLDMMLRQPEKRNP